MASLVKQTGGGYRIDFYLNDKRHSLRPGAKLNKRAVEAIKCKLEALVSAKISQQPVDNVVAQWLATIDDKLHRKLAKCGLVEPRTPRPQVLMLAAFLEDYVASRTKWSASTITCHRSSCK